MFVGFFSVELECPIMNKSIKIIYSGLIKVVHTIHAMIAYEFQLSSKIKIHEKRNDCLDIELDIHPISCIILDMVM